MCLLVETGGERWLADVGFGSQTLREPLAYEPGATADQDGWWYRLGADDPGRLQAPGPDGWFDLYRFDEVPQHHVDIVMSNHYTATHPSSAFFGRLIAQGRGDEEHHGLIGTSLTTTTVDGQQRRRELAPAEVPDVLERDFGIRLDDDEGAAVVDRLERDAGSSTH
jgi:N-hydroxyarylamine O-acetyltransferase